MISLCETLYGFPFQSQNQTDQVNKQIRALLRHALEQFEQEGEFEKMFNLLQLTPSLSLSWEKDLGRLYNRAYLYEMNRIKRNQRWLYGYLIL